MCFCGVIMNHLCHADDAVLMQHLQLYLCSIYNYTYAAFTTIFYFHAHLLLVEQLKSKITETNLSVLIILAVLRKLFILLSKTTTEYAPENKISETNVYQESSKSMSQFLYQLVQVSQIGVCHYQLNLNCTLYIFIVTCSFPCGSIRAVWGCSVAVAKAI